MDPTTITTAAAAITGLKNLTDLCKTIIPLARNAANPELSSKVQDFLDQLMDLKMTQGSLVDENSELRRTIEDLRRQADLLTEKLKLKGEMIPRGNIYYVRKLSDQTEEGKYCSHCWDVKRLGVRLTFVRAQVGYLPHYLCPECKHSAVE